jgi:hypothetical protein
MTWDTLRHRWRGGRRRPARLGRGVRFLKAALPIVKAAYAVVKKSVNKFAARTGGRGTESAGVWKMMN